MSIVQERPSKGLLTVNKKQFCDALRQIKRVPGLSGQPAVFTHNQGRLRIDLGGCSFTADADGYWEGQAAVPVRFIQSLLAPTGKKPFTISCDGAYVRFGYFRVQCKWGQVIHPRIVVPLGASLMDILLVRERHSQDEIRHAGLEMVVVDAETQAKKMTEQAAKILKPLGITHEDLWQMLDEKLAAQG